MKWPPPRWPPGRCPASISAARSSTSPARWAATTSRPRSLLATSPAKRRRRQSEGSPCRHRETKGGHNEEGLPLLDVTDEVGALAREYQNRLALPPAARLDVLHLACTVVHQLD